MARRIARRGRRLFAARLAVVSTEAWRATVLALADRCDAVIFDLSTGTENLLWELANTDPVPLGPGLRHGSPGQPAGRAPRV